jgi:hypothetical protein
MDLNIKKRKRSERFSRTVNDFDLPSDEYSKVKLFHIYKCRLTKILNDRNLISDISDICDYFGIVTFYFSKLLQFIVLKQLENNTLFDINSTSLRIVIMSIIQNNSNYLVERNLLHIPKIENKPPGLTQIVTEFIRDYLILLNNQYHDRFELFEINRLRLINFIDSHGKEKSKKYDILNSSEFQLQNEEYLEMSISKKIQTIYTLQKTIENLLIPFKDEILLHQDLKSKDPDNYKLPDKIRYLLKFKKNRPFIPNYQLSSKHIQIDTDTLCFLTNKYLSKKVKAYEFAKQQVENWIKYFDIPKESFKGRRKNNVN